MDRGFQSLQSAAFRHRYPLLQNHRSGIHAFIHIMNRHTGFLHTRIPGIQDPVCPRKFRQIRRGNVDDGIRVSRQQCGADKPHIAGQNNQFDLRSAENVQDLRLVVLLVPSLCLNVM